MIVGNWLYASVNINVLKLFNNTCLSTSNSTVSPFDIAFNISCVLSALAKDIVFTCDEVGLNSDAKEAFAFACIGYLSIIGKTGNVKASTGAKNDLVLGELSLAQRRWKNVR